MVTFLLKSTRHLLYLKCSTHVSSFMSLLILKCLPLSSLPLRILSVLQDCIGNKPHMPPWSPLTTRIPSKGAGIGGQLLTCLRCQALGLLPHLD